LLGWKVRLPLATAHSPCCVLRHVRGRHTGSPLCLPHATHSVSSVNFCVLLVTGAVSGQEPVAAVSPTFGRLFEGTDAGSPGQSPAPQPLTQRGRPPQRRPTIHTGHTRHGRSGGARFCRIRLPDRSSRPRGNLLTCLPAQFLDWSAIGRNRRGRRGLRHGYRLTVWSGRCRATGPEGLDGVHAPHPHLWITVWIACHRTRSVQHDFEPGG
jgi:hypothetical protein